MDIRNYFKKPRLDSIRTDEQRADENAIVDANASEEVSALHLYSMI